MSEKTESIIRSSTLPELKPCPFCGLEAGSDNNVEVVEKQTHLSKLFSVCCWGCGGESGVATGKNMAIAKWNMRHETSETQSNNARD